jgi:hypothetical protein
LGVAAAAAAVGCAAGAALAVVGFASAAGAAAFGAAVGLAGAPLLHAVMKSESAIAPINCFEPAM